MNKEESREYYKRYRKANKERLSVYGKKYAETNSDKLKAYRQNYYKNNDNKSMYKSWGLKNPQKLKICKLKSNQKHKEKRKAYNKRWAKNNAGLVTHYSRQYQLAKVKATPKWLTAQQLEDIREIYRNRPKGNHVDHVVPIKGKEVCGLHVSWNLQYLLAAENCSKSNKLNNK